MAKKMYTEALEKVKTETTRRNIDRLEEAIKAGDMEKALELRPCGMHIGGEQMPTV